MSLSNSYKKRTRSSFSSKRFAGGEKSKIKRNEKKRGRKSVGTEFRMS